MGLSLPAQDEWPVALIFTTDPDMGRIEYAEPQGRRVVLVRCTDPYTTLKPGTEGTVQFVDDAGTVHVRWDDGSTLGMIPGEDEWTLLGEDR